MKRVNDQNDSLDVMSMIFNCLHLKNVHGVKPFRVFMVDEIRAVFKR